MPPCCTNKDNKVEEKESIGIGLTKNHSVALHGLAITLMLFHHLFCIPARLKCDYFSVIDWIGVAGLEERIAWFCKICVAIYAFTTGYALSRINLENSEPISCLRILKQLGRFAKKYYLVFALFIPLGFLLADYSSYGTKVLRRGLLGLSTPYNGEWWYVQFYICALLTFPFLDAIYRKLSGVIRLKGAKIFAMVCAAAIFSVIMIYYLKQSREYAIILVEGYACSQWRVFEFVDRILKKRGRVMGPIILLALTIVVRAVTSTSAGYSRIDIFIIVPFIYAVTALFDLSERTSRCFRFLGKYSTYMWLTHTFFAYYIFREFITFSRIDLVIFVQLFLVSLATAYLLTKVEQVIGKLDFARFVSRKKS